METKGKCKNKSNVIKWSILVSILLLAIIGSGIGVVIAKNFKISTLASASGEENILESSSLENFEAVGNKTEEELKELNEKEIKKSEDKQKNKNSSTKKAKNKYYIKVNYGAQVVTIYTYDSKGNYTVPVKAMVCSTGTETPRSGVYKTPVKMVWCHMYGDVWAHYCTQIVGNILFHSVPFLEKNNHTLEYWEYDKLGTKASMGCIRLTTKDAKWLFDNVPAGTSVEFYSSSNPGPLGKPSALKISSAPSYLRGWDPTDPDPNNPWKNYNPQSENTSKNEANTENPSVNSTNNGNNQGSGSSSNVQNNQNSGNNSNIQNNQSSGNTSQGGNLPNNEATSGNNQNSESTTGGSGSTNSEIAGGNSQNNETAGGSTSNEVTGGNTNNEAVDGNDKNTENDQNSEGNTNTENNQSSEENKNNENNQSDGDNTKGENV